MAESRLGFSDARPRSNIGSDEFNPFGGGRRDSTFLGNLDRENQYYAEQKALGNTYGDLQAGRVKSALGNVATGFGSVFSSLPKTVGEISGAVTGTDPDESSFYKLGEFLDDAIKDHTSVNPEYQSEFTQKLAGGAGSLGGFLAGGGVGALMKVPAIIGTAVLGASAGSSEAVDDYKRTLEKRGVSPDLVDRKLTALAGGAVGLTEAAPIGHALSRLNRATKGTYKDILGAGAVGTLEEGLQEFTQQVGQNLIAKELVKYDENRGIFLDSGEAAAVGGTLGFAMNVLTASLGGRKGRGISDIPPSTEDEGVSGNDSSSTRQGELPGFERKVEDGDGKTVAVNPETGEKFQSSKLQGLATHLATLRASLKNEDSTSADFDYIARLKAIKAESKKILSKSKGTDASTIVEEKEAEAFIKSLDVEIERFNTETQEDSQADSQGELFTEESSVTEEEVQSERPLVTASGKPYKSQKVAEFNLKRRGLEDGYDVIAVEGGYALSKKETVVEEEAPVIVEEETSIVEEEVPVADPITEEESVVEEAPVVVEEEEVSVEKETPKAEEEIPVIEEESVIEEAPVIEESPVIEEVQSEKGDLRQVGPEVIKEDDTPPIESSTPPSSQAPTESVESLSNELDALEDELESLKSDGDLADKEMIREVSRKRVATKRKLKEAKSNAAPVEDDSQQLDGIIVAGEDSAGIEDDSPTTLSDLDQNFSFEGTTTNAGLEGDSSKREVNPKFVISLSELASTINSGSATSAQIESFNRANNLLLKKTGWYASIDGTFKSISIENVREGGEKNVISSEEMIARVNGPQAPLIRTTTSQPKDVKSDEVIDLDSMTSQQKKAYSVGYAAFKDFVERVSPKIKEDVTFLLSSDIGDTNSLTLPQKVELEETVGGRKSSKTYGVFVYDNTTHKKYVIVNIQTMMKRGATPADVRESVNHTLFHETVGHYGLRKLFGGRNSLDNFLSKTISKNRKIMSSILELESRWITRLDSTGKKISGSINLSPRDSFPTVEVMDLDGRKRVVDKRALLFLAEEFIAEEAAKFRDPNFLRYAESTTIGFINKVVSFVKHKLRAFLGKGSEDITRQDILGVLVASHRTIFHDDVVKSTKFPSGTQALIDEFRGGEPLSDEKGERASLVASYMVADGLDTPAAKLSLEIGADPNDILAVDRAIRSSSTRIRQSAWQERVSSMKERARSHPLYGRIATMGRTPGPRMLGYLESSLKGSITKADKLAGKSYNLLKDLTPSQEKAVYEYFTTKDADPYVLPVTDKQKSVIIESKETLMKYGDDLVSLGLLSNEVNENNRGAYLPTMYLEYLNTYGSGGSGKRQSFMNYLKKNTQLTHDTRTSKGQIKDPAFLISESIGTIGRDVALEQFFNMVIETEAVRNYGWILGNRISVDVAGMKMGLSQIEDNIDLKKKLIELGPDSAYHHNSAEDIEKLQLELESLEAAKLRFEESFNATIGKILEDMGETPTPERIDDFKSANYRRLDEKGFGKLEGLWLRKELYDDLLDYRDMNSVEGQDFMTKFFGPNGKMDRAHQWWKTGKVALNPPSWVRNAVGNFLLLDISTNTNMAALSKSLTDEVMSSIKGEETEWFRLAQEGGLWGTSFSANELYLIKRKFEKRYLQKLAKERRAKEGRVASTIANNFAFMGEKFYDTIEAATEIYGNLEGIFKTVKMKDYIQTWEKENGTSYKNLPIGEMRALMAEAISEANKAIFDYSKVPGWMKTMRRMPIGAPFLTFTYKAFPAVMEGLARRPQKFIKYMALPYMMTQALMLTQDLSDDDVEEIQRKLSKWMREKSSIYILPFKDSNGKLGAFDMGPFLPWAPFTNMYGAFSKGVEEEGAILGSVYGVGNVGKELGFLGGPLPEMIGAIKNNRDSFTGAEIMPEGATPSQKMASLYSYMHSLWLPTWLGPQGVTGHVMDDLGISIMSPAKVKNSFGTDKETLSGALLRGVGVNVYPFDVEESHRSNIIGFQIKETKIRKERNKWARNHNVSGEERARGIRDYNERLKRLREKRTEYLSGSR